MIALQVGMCLCLVAVASSLEVGVPERFLRPRNFNPHPYTIDEGRQYLEAALPQDISSLPHPYQFFERPPSRGETSSGAPIQFPKVPDAARAQPPEPTAKLKPATIKHPLNIANNQINEVSQDDLSLQNAILSGGGPQYFAPLRVAYIQEPAPTPGPVPEYGGLQFREEIPAPRGIYKSKILAPKNYAFSYAVKDGDYGDDFSHSQAHHGAQTKGEYRVKLPDGRVQVVSYTADDNGYNADVRYDHAENSVEPQYDAPVVKYKQVYKPVLKQLYKPSYKSYYQLQPRPKSYTPIHEGPTEQPPASPREIFPGHPAALQFVQSTPAPVALTYSHSTPRPFKKASFHHLSPSSPAPDGQQAYYVSSSPAPDYYAVSSTPDPDYYAVSSTASPEQELVYPSSTVPPRYAPAASRHNYYLVQKKR